MIPILASPPLCLYVGIIGICASIHIHKSLTSHKACNHVLDCYKKNGK